jgi:hypothetical protein
MRNNKPIPRNELKCGMRVKIPWQGSYFGSKKKYLWLKGTITKLGKRGINTVSVEISLRNSHGFNNLGKCLCLGNNVDYIYKQL